MSNQENNATELEQLKDNVSNNTEKKGFWKGLGSKIVSTTENVLSQIDKAKEAKQRNDAIEKAFYEKCETFVIPELQSKEKLFNSYKIKAIRNADTNTFYVKEDEKLLEKLKAGIHLSAVSDNANFEILQAYGEIEYPISINENEFFVRCRKIQVKFTEKKTVTPSPIQQTVNQTITIQGDNNAQINQIASIDDQLNQIENAIKGSKGNLIKKADAERKFKQFKVCIQTRKADESLFKKFCTVLKDLSLDVTAKLVVELIARTFNL